MIILITGAGGFLSTHIARELRRHQCRIIGVGRGVSSVAGLYDRVYEISLPSPAFETLVQDEQPTYCIHTAGPASVRDSMLAPGVDFERQVLPWLQVLDTLRAKQPNCRTMLLSSAAVYGEPKALPVSEIEPVGPLSPYGFHRHCCERLQEEYRSLYGLQGTALRIFSAYGPGLRRQVVWDLCVKALNSDHIRLQGTGAESRDFVHADDVAAAVAVLVNTDAWAPIYNVGSGSETTISALAAHVTSLLPHPKSVIFDGVVARGTPHRWHADISKLSALGYTPRRSFPEGVSEVFAACQRELGTRPR